MHSCRAPGVQKATDARRSSVAERCADRAQRPERAGPRPPADTRFRPHPCRPLPDHRHTECRSFPRALVDPQTATQTPACHLRLLHTRHSCPVPRAIAVNAPQGGCPWCRQSSAQHHYSPRMCRQKNQCWWLDSPAGPSRIIDRAYDRPMRPLHSQLQRVATQ